MTAPEERQTIYWRMSCPILKNEKYLENDTLLLRFACDGPKFQKTNSVRGVFILIQRNSLPEDVKGISMSPEDEFTLFFFTLVYLVPCFNFTSIHQI